MNNAQARAKSRGVKLGSRAAPWALENAVDDQLKNGFSFGGSVSVPLVHIAKYIGKISITAAAFSSF